MQRSPLSLRMASTEVITKVSEEISKALGAPFIGSYGSGGGGGGSGASTFIIQDEKSKQEYFVKMANLGGFDMLRTEYEGIKVMYQTNTIRVPKPICYGSADYNSFAVFEKLSLGGRADAALSGRKLAEMHTNTSPNGKFGWDFTNTCGATPQPNKWCDTWAEFWDTQRLGHMLDLADKSGGNFPEAAELRAKVKSILERHECVPSAVHGDLWGGNIGATKDGDPVIYGKLFTSSIVPLSLPSIFDITKHVGAHKILFCFLLPLNYQSDPAFYYGDKEVDIAMTKLFGSQYGEFYKAYDEVHPPKEGWQQREVIYNLYHILNHYVLFGGSYLGSAKQMIGKILKF